MKLALLVYGDPAWDDMPHAERRSFHAAHRELHAAEGAVSVGEHFRFRAPDQAVTLRRVGDDVARSDGPSSDVSGRLRALYLVDAADVEEAIGLARRLPALAIGGTVEVWPISSPASRP
jgi:hypothetical protein